MPSSASDPLSGIPQELKDLFSWNPPPLNPLSFPGKKTSTKTRPPAFFDRHFSPELKLLRVERLPSLARDIAAIVDETILNSFNDGFQFPPSGKLPSAEILDFSVLNMDWDMADEKAVASFYDKTTATFCAPVASTLALRLSDWNTLLVWTQSANVSGYAIADGFLKVASPTNLAKKETQLKEAMGEETLRLLQLLSTRRASLVTNEFKDMAAGGLEVMLAIPNLSNSQSFDWTGCEFPDCASMIHHVKEREKLAAVFGGPDAKNTPWTIAPASVSGPLPASVPPLSLSTGSSSVQGSSEDVGTSKALSMTHPTKIATNCPRSSSFNRQANIPYFLRSITLISDFTKAWAQATRVDGSIIVLQSGNHEFIGIRHRTTQTLYISDLIKPHACKEPSYGRLHVGIYIAGIMDALDRERQRDARPPGGGNGPSGSGGDKQDGPSGGGPGTAHKMAAKSTLLASGRNVILLYLQYGIYDSSAPSTFVRSGPTGHPIPRPSQETVRNYQLEECLTIILKSEIGHGATGQVLRGTLEVEASECASLDVAVKLALGSEQCEALRDEFKIYQQLRSKGVTTGITTSLGLFDDVQGGACTLVMPYVGAPLAATPKEAVLATLVEIHRADILHGDLRLDADSGLIIIDFGHSRVSVDQDAKDREYLQLRSLLYQREK
ncbi:hypothetical protein F5887DRAFT_882970 [Amanita rubescens]|nr:hypothetical protein F5887DRAFT_882970 [Amanita rubescens]